MNDVTADDGVGTSGIHPDGIQITVPPELDVNNPAKGNYTVNYTVSDNAGNTSSEDREVEITDADDLVNEVGKVTPAVLNGKTPDSVKQVEDAKKEAEDVINNPISTQKEIDDALKKLQEAIAGLVAPVVHAPAISGGGYNTHPVRPSS